MNSRFFPIWIIFLLSIFLFPAQSFGQQPSTPDSILLKQAVPVIFNGDTLFFLYSSIGPFTPKSRADAIVTRIINIADNPLNLADTFLINQGELTTDILNGDVVIMSLTDEDARLSGKSRQDLAFDYKQKLRKSINQEIDLSSPKAILKNIGLVILAIFGLFLLFYGTRKLFDLFRRRIKLLEKNFLFRNNKYLKFFKYITPKREQDVLLVISRTLRYTVYFLALFFYLPLMFAILPWTRGYVAQLYSWIAIPLKSIWKNFVDFVPDMIVIIIILVITQYVLKLMKYITQEIEKERIVFPGFYGDWAQPTYKLLRVLVYLFALVVIFPYLPGSDSPAFQGVTIFVGLLFSLGSTTAVANMVAGIVITYMRPFQVGDRVRIGGAFGDVIDRTLLVTRIRTIKNEDITIPNAQILNGQIMNYSIYSDESHPGLILNTTVTIGYDVPWEKVHELLIVSAEKAERVEKEPKPFVLQTSLDDFYVSYQLNAYTRQPGKAAVIYSEIHKHILDTFNEAQVEILSPHYGAHRDGNILTIPPENLPDGYETPSFRITNPLKDIFNPDTQKPNS